MRPRRSRRWRSAFRASLTLTLFSVAFLLRGHDTWLMPDHSMVRPGQAVSFDLTSGMAFPALDHTVASDRLANASFRQRGKTFDILNRNAGAHSLKLRATFGED